MKTMQTSYASGVLAPSLHSRNDLAKWQIGLAEANNLLVHVHGGISNRAGLYYDGASYANKRPRMIPFNLTADQDVNIEFTDQYMRLVQNGVVSDFPPNTNGWVTNSVAIDLAASPGGSDPGSHIQAPNPQHDQIRYRFDFELSELPASGFKDIASCGIAVNANGYIYLAKARNSDGYHSEAGNAWYYSTGNSLPVGERVTLEVSRDGDTVTISRPGVWSYSLSQSGYNIPTQVPAYVHAELGDVGNHVNTYQGSVSDSGTTDGGVETTTVTDSAATWTVDEYVGFYAINTTRDTRSKIVSNTATVLTVENDLATQNGDSYQIVTAVELKIYEYSAITPADGYVFRLLPEVSDPGTNVDGHLRDAVDDVDYFDQNEVTNVYPMTVVGEEVVIPDVASPYAEADICEVRYAQREDVMYFTHPSYPEYALTRFEDHWEMGVVERASSLAAPTNLAGVYSGTPTTAVDTDYIVAALDAYGEETVPSEVLTQSTDTAANWKVGNYLTLSWDPIPGADQYVVYKNTRGYFGYIGSTTATEFIDDNIAPDSADGPKVYRDPFGGVGNYPKAVGIHQQRKVYGGPDNAPQSGYLTRSGSMVDMSISRPLKDTDAITAQLDVNRRSHILHMASMRDLVVLTNNGVWTLTSGVNSDALTPTSVRYDFQDAVGASRIEPIISGNTMLLVPSYRDGVKELFFQIQSQGLEGSDLEILSNHLFEYDSITSWAYDPADKLIYCVMDSGTACVLTYLREHEVVAWTTLDTQGEFIDVSVAREADRYVPYFAVKRNLDGVDTYCIEHMTERLPGGVLADSVFMDAAVSYNGAATDTFAGALHLANETCVVLADGNVIEGVEVDAAGGFVLPHPYSKVHIGLGYVSDFETLDVDYGLEDGTGFGDRKVINAVILSIEKTRGLQVGPDSSDLVEMADRTDEDYDEHTRMITGKKKVEIPSHWNSNGRIHVRQKYPLPMTILSHIPEVVPGDS